jgi:hypothetical protein
MITTIFNSKDKSNMLDLKVYDLLNELSKRGEELAKDINEKFLIDIVKSNFLGDFEYILEELKFIKLIGETFYLNLNTLKHIEELEELNKESEEKIIKNFMPINFNWELQRFYTDEEEKIRNKKRNELAIKIIKKMKKEGRI